jgi:hypothetical protein
VIVAGDRDGRRQSFSRKPRKVQTQTIETDYRICRLGYFTNRPVGDASFTGKFGVASYPQQGRGGPGIFLTSASCSTSQQAIDFADLKHPYPEFWGGYSEF